MPVYDLFSKRQKKLRGEFPDIFTYDKIPNKLRVQIIHIIRDAVGEDHYSENYAQSVTDSYMKHYVENMVFSL